MEEASAVDGLGTFKYLDMYDTILSARDDAENDRK